MIITRAEALNHFDYNKATGELIWKSPRGNSVAVGDVAGTNNHGYLQIRFNYKSYYVHRVIWLLVNGEWPDQIDHIDHNGFNNKLDNLRNVNHQGNGKNRRLNKNNKSGVCGVGWTSSRKKWRSVIEHNNKAIHLGFTDDFFEAVCLRKSAEIKYGFHINHGNR
jgi:hypothetical protein